LWTHQLQLTIADLVAEVHDTHHPVAVSQYYEDQKKEARRKAADFLKNRVPKYVGYFEKILASNKRGDRYLLGAKLSYPDLSLFQVVAGLTYAFPNTIAQARRKYRHIFALHARIQERPRIAAYLKSPRRIPFNEDGIFRHYPELEYRSRAK
jgi:glutathione S-transferase